MQFNQSDTDNFQDIFYGNEKMILCKTIENHNYLYPNGHCFNQQMRWFKVIFERGLKPYIAI